MEYFHLKKLLTFEFSHEYSHKNFISATILKNVSAFVVEAEKELKTKWWMLSGAENTFFSFISDNFK